MLNGWENHTLLLFTVLLRTEHVNERMYILVLRFNTRVFYLGSEARTTKV